MDVTFISGNILQFSTQFYNPTGNPITPDSATLTLRTATLNAPSVTVTIPMTAGLDNTWMATWDTTGFAIGVIFWSVKAVNPHAADEGSFELTGNWANA